GAQLADPEAGVHRRRGLVNHRPAAVAVAVAGPALRDRRGGLAGAADQVARGHACCLAAACRAASSTRYWLDASTCRRAASTSASSLPSRLWTLPPMITVSTLETSAQRVTAATGSITGATFSAVASMTTTSACLPGVSEPVRS